MKFTRLDEKVYADSGLGKWFGSGGKGGTTKGGWDRYNTKGEKIGKCGDKKASEGKPKCLSANKAAKMSKKEIANAVRRKRKKDPSTDRPGTGNKPINVSNRIGEDWSEKYKKSIDCDNPKGFSQRAHCAGREKNEGNQMKSFTTYIIEDWQKINRKDKTDGLSQKAVDAYRRENPGSKLKTAVTEKKPKGKRAARRKSFCSRMKGMKSKLTSAKTRNDPDSRINKALRRWNC